ncbi:MAG TPA: methylenetetrahydrofolate reductase [Candidatus Hydrogenedentes bacterium]|nr:methylenetetrahydrofolate reductase [Candidatus Hydrogenedentota bacterium]
MIVSETRFQEKILSGEPLLVVEIVPPRSGDPAPVRAAAKRFAGKVHAVGVSDNRHGVCMSALAASAVLAAEGAEPIMHLVTRDRNRLALIASCLGAQAMGVRNLLCTSGTHQTLGICPSAKNVFDIDSVQLIAALTNLGTDASVVSKTRIENAGPFCVGGAVSPFADPQEMQLIKASKKVLAGAQFLITQPVFDIPRFRAWWEAASQCGLPRKTAILAGIQPLLDAERAKAFASGRPLPMVPQAQLDRLAAAGGKQAQRAAGIELAVETIKQISASKGIRGFQICAEDDEEAVLEIIQRSGLEAR